VSEQGLILETNFTAAAMMGAARSELVNKPLSRFIVKTDQDTYYRCRKTLFEDGSPQECELQMLKRNGCRVLGPGAGQRGTRPTGRAGATYGDDRHFTAQTPG
jgi:PAS domain-containing protein